MSKPNWPKKKMMQNIDRKSNVTLVQNESGHPEVKIINSQRRLVKNEEGYKSGRSLLNQCDDSLTQEYEVIRKSSGINLDRVFSDQPVL